MNRPFLPDHSSATNNHCKGSRILFFSNIPGNQHLVLSENKHTLQWHQPCIEAHCDTWNMILKYLNSYW